MSLWEYESRLYHWNEAHKVEGAEQKSDPEKMERMFDMLNDNPDLLSANPKSAGAKEPAKIA